MSEPENWASGGKRCLYDTGAESSRGVQMNHYFNTTEYQCRRALDELGLMLLSMGAPREEYVWPIIIAVEKALAVARLENEQP